MTTRPPRSASELLAARYGVRVMTRSNPYGGVLGTSDSVIAENNPRRLSLLVVNLSSTNIYVRPEGPASSTDGIWLAPNGGSLSLTLDDDYVLPSREWHGVAGAAGAVYYLSEVLIL